MSKSSPTEWLMSIVIAVITVVAIIVLTTTLSSAVELKTVAQWGNSNTIIINGRSRKTSDSVVNHFSVEVKQFDQLLIDVPANITYRKGKPGVKIKAQEHVYQQLNIKSNNGKLSLTANSFSSDKDILIEISSDSLRELEILNATVIHLHDLKNDNFLLKIDGITTLVATGSINDCQLIANGSVEIDMRHTYCQNIDMDIEANADIIVHATEHIRGSLEGVVTLNVLGEPKKRELELSGITNVLYKK